jgi:glutaminase
MAGSTESKERLQKIFDAVADQVRKAAPAIYREAVEDAEARGKPAPRKADFERFGIAAFTSRGELISAGNAGVRFPLQSISKVFALEIALAALGVRLWKRIGREPSGDPFSSIIDLEKDKGIPRNPFINPGALVVCDVLVGLGGRAGPNRHVVDFVQRQLDGEKVELRSSVMRSDRTGGNLNRSLMYMAKHHGNLKHEVEAVMDAYVHQCAITLDCRDLARAGRFLMQVPDENGAGAARRARRILSTMMLCGMYDGAGEFAYRVGLPAKSGVGGGILAVAPAKASIAVWSPALDRMGNSRLGILGLELLTNQLDWSVFGAPKYR